MLRCIAHRSFYSCSFLPAHFQTVFMPLISPSGCKHPMNTKLYNCPGLTTGNLRYMKDLFCRLSVRVRLKTQRGVRDLALEVKPEVTIQKIFWDIKSSLLCREKKRCHKN